jgi:hypothetical protein
MGKSSSAQPKQPSPTSVAQAQTASNVDTAVANAWLNSGNSVSPWGNVTTNQVGSQTGRKLDVPIFSQTTTLSPEQQKLYEQGVQGDTQLNQLGLDQIGRIQNAVKRTRSRSTSSARRPLQIPPPERRPITASFQERPPAGSRPPGPGAETRDARNRRRLGGLYRCDAELQLGDQRLPPWSRYPGGQEETNQYNLNSTAYQQQISNALLQRQQPLQEAAQFSARPIPSVPQRHPGAGLTDPADGYVTSPIYANYNARLQQQQNNQATRWQFVGRGRRTCGRGSRRDGPRHGEVRV